MRRRCQEKQVDKSQPQILKLTFCGELRVLSVLTLGSLEKARSKAQCISGQTEAGGYA